MRNHGKHFPDDESICAFIRNEPYKPMEIISLENNKIPKGLTPLESSFSTSDVSNSKDRKEEESKQKIGDIILVNIGTQETPNI
jgi:hypothetical protein